MKTFKLVYGDNKFHEFWENPVPKSDRLIIMKIHKNYNKPKLWNNQWTVHREGRKQSMVFGDDKLNAKNPKGTFSLLCGKTPAILARKLMAQEEIKIEFDFEHTYQDNPKDKEENMIVTSQKPSSKVIKDARI